MTEAGAKLVQRFLSLEAEGRLIELRDSRTGRTFKGMPLENNNGGQKAAAAKLTREGLAGMQWSRSFGSYRGRYFWLTQAGREAIQSKY